MYFILIIALFKLLIAPYFPLIGDEAYYWLWGRHLDWSYVDHPPLIAYLNYVISALSNNSELAVRIGAIAIVLLISWIIYLIGKELYDAKTGRIAAVLFNLLPTFFGGGLFLVPQTLFFLFWTLSIYLMIKISRTQKSIYWYLLGLSIGLGLLSDYIMVLFFAGAAGYFIFKPKSRSWLSRQEPYFAVVIALLVFSPVIYWNLAHSRSFVGYHEGRANLASLQNILYFIVIQSVLYTPNLFYRGLKLSVQFFRWSAAELLEVFSLAVFIPFVLLSPFIGVGGHWTAAAYLAPLFSVARAKRASIVSTICFALLVNALAFTYYIFLYPAPKDMVPNYKLADYLKGNSTVVSNNLGLGALVAFHGRTTVYMPPGRHPQYDLWGLPKVGKGDNVIYFALGETELYGKLKPLFQTVRIDPQKRIFTKDADIPNQTRIYICRGFKGSGIIP